MSSFRVKINEQRWTVKFVRRIQVDGEPCYGVCDVAKREIRLERGLTGQQLLDTVIHEIMHAAGWNLDEQFIEQTATDIATALTHPRVMERL